VYVTLQKTAEQVADRLAGAGFAARAYHAGMDSQTRTEVQEWWMASDHAIVVATIAFGMGIDKAAVRYVYHYNLPKSLESYSQEIGRAGRDGQPSTVELLACPDDVPTLENFAYGDTPTREALRSVVDELLAAGRAFDVSVTDLSARHDVRQLVLRTILTYLELLGILRQGTPFYASYEIKPLQPLEDILGRFDAERRRFLGGVFGAAKKGRLLYRLDPGEVATQLGADRERVLRALHYLEEHGQIELRPSEARQRFSRVDDGATDRDAVLATLEERFQRREQQEIARIQHVLALVEHAGCQTAALVGYFGEQLAEPCGHCSFCASAHAVQLPASTSPRLIADQLDGAGFAALCRAHPSALGDVRQQARFLCGLSSPAVSQARLSRNPFFGLLEEHRFADVMAACLALPSTPTG
jgi:ATP-dependent DNA helicase RecQ